MGDMNRVVPRRRPKLVWVITIFYGLSAIAMLVGAALFFAGKVPLTPEGKAYIAGLTAVDGTMSLLQAFVQLAAVVALFLLKAMAARLFLANLLIGLEEQVRLALTKDWLDVVLASPGMLLGSLVSLAVLFFLVYYSGRLEREGVLT